MNSTGKFVYHFVTAQQHTLFEDQGVPFFAIMRFMDIFHICRMGNNKRICVSSGENI